MIRKGFLLPVMAAGALTIAGQAQASVKLVSTGGLINQLHSSSLFTSNNFGFSLCTNGNCQTLFTGVQGLHDLNNLNSFNSWANTGSYSGTSGYFDNYKFTFTGVGSYFGNRVASPPVDDEGSNLIVPPQAVPEPATWAMMILGFGIVGLAMRRRVAATNFA